jgi:cytochrome b561
MSAVVSTSYSVPQKAIHWLMALLIFFNLIFSENIEAWDHAVDEGKVTPEIIANANIHAYVGIAVLALAVLRLALRLAQGAPAAPAEEPPLFQLAAKLAHGGLYLLFFLMPISGMLKYYADVDLAGFVHAEPMKLVLWALVVGHIVAIPVHHFVWKTNVAMRMSKG